MAHLATERLDTPDKAADFWRQVHQADKHDRDARAALLTAYERLGKWKEFAEILRLEVDAIPHENTEEKLDGFCKLVRTISSHLRQDAQVIQLYGQILELAPGDDEAIDALCQKYEKMRRWPDLISLLRQSAEDASEDEQIAVSLRIARVYLDKMRNQMEATRAYEEVLATYPDNEEALRALDGLYEKRREWDSLVSIRTRLADLNEDADARIAAYKRTRRICRQEDSTTSDFSGPLGGNPSAGPG